MPVVRSPALLLFAPPLLSDSFERSFRPLSPTSRERREPQYPRDAVGHMQVVIQHIMQTLTARAPDTH